MHKAIEHFCCLCDHRSLDEPVMQLEKRGELHFDTCWLCNSCAKVLAGRLEAVVAILQSPSDSETKIAYIEEALERTPKTKGR